MKQKFNTCSLVKQSVKTFHNTKFLNISETVNKFLLATADNCVFLLSCLSIFITYPLPLSNCCQQKFD